MVNYISNGGGPLAGTYNAYIENVGGPATGTNGAYIEDNNSASASVVTPITIFGSAAVLQWVRADKGVTVATGVSTWADQTANGKDYSQGSTTLQPSFNVSDSTLNNLPTIAFNGTNHVLNAPGLTLSTPSGVTPSCILAVAKTRTFFGTNMVFLNPATSTTLCCCYSAATNGVWGELNGFNVGSVAQTANTWNRLRFDFSNSASDIIRCGSVQSTQNAGNAAQSVTGRTISGYPGAPWPGTIYELLYLNIIPTPTQMTAYDAYLTSLTAGVIAV